MIMKSQLTFSDFCSRYALSRISKLQFIGSSEKKGTVETNLEQSKLAPQKSLKNQGSFDVSKDFFLQVKLKQQQQRH